MEVLLIEDNPDDAFLVEELLQDGGWPVIRPTHADRLSRAFELTRDTDFDAVLLDLILPDSQGLDTFRKVRHRLPDLPVVVLTGLDDEQTALEALKDGAQDYLPKNDISNLLLRRTIRYAIERKRSETALRRSEEKRRAVLENAPDPVVAYDDQERVVYINPAFTRVFGWSLEACQGRPLEFTTNEFLPEERELWQSLEDKGAFYGVETKRLTRTGRLVDVSISGALSRDRSGNDASIVFILQDITRRKQAEENLRHLAYHDPLTGLPNRKAFYERLMDAINQAQRSEGHNRLALLFIDLDHFKHINDTMGHNTGDLWLKDVAGRLMKHIRKSDHVFRLGGDEFTVILTNLSQDIDAAKIANNLIQSISEPFKVEGREFYNSASIGISIYPENGLSVEHLVKNADTAMYAAKEERNRYRFFNQELNRKAQERIRLECDLRRALSKNEFRLHYQPLVDDQKKILGVEALCRWQHPELGLLEPKDFIPLAEETGLIVEIGQWVLDSALSSLKKWHGHGFRDLFVAVNISPRQFKQPNLVESVLSMLDKQRISPKMLQLEVTESCILENPEAAIEKMNRLHEHGVRLSVDDFGTGYSSLNRLCRFPIQSLKIDRSFIGNVGRDGKDLEIVKMIIAMAHSLGIEPVAEGVEDDRQWEFMREHGCRWTQGFLFSRPLPESEMDIFLTTNRQNRRLRVV